MKSRITYVDQTQEETPEVTPVTLKEIRNFALPLQRYRHETDGDFLATADTLINSSEIKIVKQKCALKQRVISDIFKKLWTLCISVGFDKTCWDYECLENMTLFFVCVCFVKCVMSWIINCVSTTIIFVSKFVKIVYDSLTQFLFVTNKT